MTNNLLIKRTPPQKATPVPNIVENYKGPNVSQYGWTTFEVEQIKQLIQYVDMAREAAEAAVGSAKYASEAVDDIRQMKDEITNMYNNYNTYYQNMLEWYTDFTDKYRDFLVKYQEVLNVQVLIEDLTTKVSDTYLRVVELTDQAAIAVSSAKASATAAEVSNIGAKGWYDKSYELYEALSRGMVYRGTWNPHSGAYPSGNGTNSTWDVVLNEGDLEVPFDGKRWFWGDRLIYALDTNSYVQVESGTTVTSVNGKKGAVVITAADLDAVTNATLANTFELKIRDIRDTNYTPNEYPKGKLSTFFNSGTHGLPSVGDWYSGINMSGWPDPNYRSWQLASTAHSNGGTDKLWFRTSSNDNTGWKDWGEVYTSQNKQTPETIGAGRFPGAWYTFAGSVASISQNSYRIAPSGGNAGIGNFWRNDGSNLYLMFTENGQALDGAYNNLRPARWNLTSGAMEVGHDLTVGGRTTFSNGDVSVNNGNVYIDCTAQRRHLAFRYANPSSYVWVYVDPNDKRLKVDSPTSVSGDLLVTSANGSNQHFKFYNWGSSDRPAVMELKDDVSYHWYSQRNTNGSIELQTNGTLNANGRITASSGSDIGFMVNGKPSGSSNAGLRVEPQGGSYASWRERAAAIQVDCPGAANSAYSIFKATQWGSHHICSFNVHSPGQQPQGILYMGDGNFSFSYTGDFQASRNGNFNDVYIRSDGRLKHNRKKLEGALDKIDKIEAQSYDKQMSLTDDTIIKREVGIIAQDLQKVLPEAVNEAEDSTLTISNSAVSALLLQAIKELKAEVDQLKRELGR